MTWEGVACTVSMRLYEVTVPPFSVASSKVERPQHSATVPVAASAAISPSRQPVVAAANTGCLGRGVEG